jgi:DNA-binding transcriptional regulator YdaS (Cro superfamily)
MTIQGYLDAKRMSKRALARQIGVSPSRVCAWLKGAGLSRENVARLISGTQGEISANDVFAPSTRKRRRLKAA